MAWVIDSNNSPNPKTQALRWHLLLSYLAVMLAIFSVSMIAVYQFVRHSLYGQLDQRLEGLAQAASHNLMAIRQPSHESRQHGGKSPDVYANAFRRLDHDGDLDIPWQNLRQPNQGVEWFDPNRRRVGHAGTLLPDIPPRPGYQMLHQGRIRTVTIAAYSYKTGRQHLEGYIRTSEETAEVEGTLNQLRWGLGLGGIVVLCLTGIGGVWLTRQSLKPIEQSFNQLKQFTADASHELRSPLTAIKTSVEVIQAYPERIHPKDVKKIAAIASAATQMTHLVEDLLLLARMDTATYPTPDWTVVQLNDILKELLILLELQAQEKQIALNVDRMPGVWVLGNTKQLARLFGNLLENGLQYTPAGGTVTLSMKPLERTVIVSVEDTGIGIAPEHLALVFDRFWRADKARSRREKGSGLGLAIAKAIAQRHHGDITVHSQLGVGSCFQVCLPLVQ
ncbi:MAG TPA: HAMP domain-containing sensor histidine kinase [Stenomitos sp.]